MRKGTQWGAIVGLGAAMMLAGAAGGIAQDKLAQIKARQDFMERQQHDIDAIGDYGKGKGDKATALAKVNDLLSLSGKIVDQFPPGTSAADFPGKSKAKPAIWLEMDKFKAIPPTLHALEVKLAGVIETGTPQEVRAAMGSTYHNGCTACHGPYRLPEH